MTRIFQLIAHVGWQHFNEVMNCAWRIPFSNFTVAMTYAFRERVHFCSRFCLLCILLIKKHMHLIGQSVGFTKMCFILIGSVIISQCSYKICALAYETPFTMYRFVGNCSCSL